jgi:hypothetical protein
MKKLTLLIACLLMTVWSSHAQLFTEPTCGDPLGSNLYGPMYTISSANATSRTATIYPSSQLTSIAGQVVNGIYFNRSTTGVPMEGTPNFKIYVKETTAVDFGAAALDWATAITGATLVYDSNPAAIIGTNSGWKGFPLSTNFTYSGTQNLAVFFEYQNSSVSNAISWRYEYSLPCVNTANPNGTKYTNNTTGYPTSLGTSTFRRPTIGFDYLVSCNAPAFVSINTITASSANVSWVAPTILPSNGYEYYVSTTDMAPISSTTATATVPTGTTASITSLSSNTSYYIWVRSVCDAGEKSVWKAANPFKTSCSTVTDFVQNFDAYPTGTGNLPDCWSKAGTSQNVYTTTGGIAPGSAPNRLFLNISSVTSAFAILPPVSNLQANTHRLKFKAYSTAINKVLEVGYFTNPNDISTFVSLQQFGMPSTVPANAQEFTLIPTTIPVGVSQLVMTTPTGAATTIYIDDVKWEINSPCVEPSQLTASQITNNNAQLSWVNGGPETAWDIQYGPVNFQLGTGTTISNITTNPYLLTGLLANTNYHYYVRGICSGPINSSWAGPFSFKTQCNEVTNFTEVFEGYAIGSNNPMPDCWNRGGTGTTNIAGGSVAPMSPTNRLYMFANGGATVPTEAIAILPTVSNLQANTHRLRFKAYATVANRPLQIGYLTDPSNVNSFVFLEEILLPGPSATDAIEFQIIPGALPAGVKNLGIKNIGISTGSTAAYLDDFSWEAIPSCTEPSALTVNLITTASATLGWTESGSATSWEIQYGAPGFTLGTGTIVPASSNPFVLIGLTSNTNYVYYVRAVCSVTDSSPWTGPLAFKTQCDPVTAFTQNFEGLPTGSNNPMPECWSRAGVGNTYITTGSTAPMSPANRLYMFASGAATPPTEAFAIMPAVSNLSLGTHRLKFKAYANALNRVIEVGYVTDASDMTTFQFIQEISLPGTAATTAVEFTIIPGALPAGAKNLVIKNPGFPSNTTTVYLDDFKWEAIPTCLEPTSLLVNSVTTNSASLTWTEGGSATAWEIEYGAPGFTQGTGTIVPASSNPFLLSGLTSNTNYTFYVRAVCSPTDSSFWIGPLAFKTLCDDSTEFTMNFEGFPTGSTSPMVDCWSKLGTGLTYTTTGSVAPMSPVNRLYMFASGTATPPTEILAVMPSVSNLAAATHQLKFKAYSTTANRFVQLGYLTNPTDASSFVLLTSFDLPGTAASTALEFTYAPAALPAGVKNLAFRHAPLPGGSAIIYIDDVSWNAQPTTAPVCATNIVATPNATCGNFATTFVWDVTPGADGYKMTIGTTAGGSEVLNNVNIGSSPTYSFAGNFNTTYYYKVVPFNVVGDAVGCVEQSFTTALNGCYCTPIYTTGVTSNDMMSNIVITGTTLSNNTGNITTAPSYNYYTGQPNYTATLVEGTTYDVAVTVGSGGAQGVGIWIDFNDNFIFEASEKVGFTATNIAANATGILQMLMPCNAPTGLHRMRIRNVFSTLGTIIDPCASYTWGEAEDYDVTIAELATPTGDATQSITAATAADATIEDLVVVGTGVKWFATAVDALANTNQLPVGSLITNGTTYYAVSSAGTCNSAALAVTAVVTLSVDGFDNANFKYYPNPVTDVLTVSYSNTISEVVVHNLLGQQVLISKPNATQTQVDLSGLNAGTYMIKITSEELVKTIKVVKN